MAPRIDPTRRQFDVRPALEQLHMQWTNPGDVFSVLLILGGDVVRCAIAQLAGSYITPVAFSFGWVGFAVTTLVSAIGEYNIMPVADCACKVINAQSGYVRDNYSWLIGRVVRDFRMWKDEGQPDQPIEKRVDELLNEAWEYEKNEAEKKERGSGERAQKPLRAGLCISVYIAGEASRGHPGYDAPYITGCITSFVQLGLAAIPFALYSDWSIMMVTVVGIVLCFITGALPQWREEKWRCRTDANATYVMTRGNGSQHAMVIIGSGKGLNLEDLAVSHIGNSYTSSMTRTAFIILAVLWVLLLVVAAGIKENSWFLLAIGAVGIFQNIYVTGASRSPVSFGMPLKFVEVIAAPKVMNALYAVETEYPKVGKSMLSTFFPGDIWPREQKAWEELAHLAKQKKEQKITHLQIAEDKLKARAAKQGDPAATTN